jgi:hypothetical protein
MYLPLPIELAMLRCVNNLKLAVVLAEVSNSVCNTVLSVFP